MDVFVSELHHHYIDLISVYNPVQTKSFIIEYCTLDHNNKQHNLFIYIFIINMHMYSTSLSAQINNIPIMSYTSLLVCSLSFSSFTFFYYYDHFTIILPVSI
jgi:hypothetical protein